MELEHYTIRVEVKTYRMMAEIGRTFSWHMYFMATPNDEEASVESSRTGRWRRPFLQAHHPVVLKRLMDKVEEIGEPLSEGEWDEMFERAGLKLEEVEFQVLLEKSAEDDIRRVFTV
jgi:hypothetical protein